MTNLHKVFPLILLIAFMLQSCGKDDPATIAEISILSPAQLAEFDIYDTIAVKVLVKTPTNVAIKISVQLTNEKFIPVQSALVLENAATNQELAILYPIVDSTLADGIYNLKVQAFGSIQTSQAYRQIWVNEIPQILKSIWLVGEIANKIVVKVLASNFQLQKEIAIEGDYSGSAVSSVNGQFYIAGEKLGNLTAFDGYNHSPDWFVPGVPSPNQPYFTFVKSFGDVCYVGFWQGQVIGFNKFGGAIQATSFNENNVPLDAYVHDAFLINSATRRSNPSQQLIATYFVQSGTLISEQNVTFVPIGFSAPEFRKILMHGNKNGKVDAFILDLASGLIYNPYQPFSFPDEKIITTARINDLTTLLALESGIFIYEIEKSLTKINDLQEVTAMDYNHINHTIFATSGNQLFVMNLQGDTFFQVDAGMSLLNIHLLFNK